MVANMEKWESEGALMQQAAGNKRKRPATDTSQEVGVSNNWKKPTLSTCITWTADGLLPRCPCVLPGVNEVSRGVGRCKEVSRGVKEESRGVKEVSRGVKRCQGGVRRCQGGVQRCQEVSRGVKRCQEVPELPRQKKLYGRGADFTPPT